MATSDVSPAAYRRTFGLCLVVVNAWAFIRAFAQAPSWLLNHTGAQLFGRFAYIATAALIESAALCLLLIAVSRLLPRTVYRQRLVAQSAIVLLCLAGWAAYWHSGIFAWQRFLPLVFLATGGVLLGAVLLSWWLMRFTRVHAALDSAAARLEILAALYLALNVIGVIVVAVRNVV